MRIVSMDYCADQFLLKLVDRERILALSKDAQRSFSYMREAAVGLPQVRASAEDVLALKPDLVVRSYGGGPNVKGFLERAGVPVLNVGWANDIASVKRVINEMATSLGEPERGAAVVAEMDARLAAIDLWGAKPSALYMTPAGVTSGPGSLVHEMLIASGLENYQSTRGWRALPLEQLVLQPPDMVAAAFFETKTNHKSGWSPTRHPVARAQLRDTPTTYLEGAWTSCGGWYLLDAIEALAAGKPKS
ncbi:MAG: ABC transporter substrate-binding protein [Pseudomonadota bacterium]